MGLNGRRRQALQLALGITISAVCIWLLLRQVDLRLAGEALAHAQWPFLLGAAGMYFVAVSIRAWRWTLLLRPVKMLSLREVWPVTVIGYAANIVLPARLGEVLRAAVLRTRGVAMSAGLATIAAERAIDGLTTVALLILTMPLLPQSAPQWLLTGGRIVGAVFALGLVALWLILASRPLVVKALDWLTERTPLLAKPADITLRFVDGLAVLHSPSLLLRVFGLTGLAWLASIAEYWLAVRSVGVQLSFAAATFSISAIGLSMAVPAAPGNLGTQELIGVAVLGLWGIPAASALAASLAFHFVDVVPIGIAGIVVAWREGISIRPRAELAEADFEGPVAG